jgi:F0F1-type ATP synthase delta subunit
MDLTDLSKLFKTKVQADDFSSSLDQIIRAIYSADFNFEQNLLQHFGQTTSDELLRLYKSQNNAIQNPGLIKQFLEAIKDQISKLPVLNLTLAFPPRENTLKVITSWFMLNLKKQVLLSIKVDPTLIGGAYIDFNGKHFEYSIQNKVSSIIDQTYEQPTN